MSKKNTATTPVTDTPTGSTSIIDLAVEAVVGLVNALDLYATMKRGPLSTAASLVCDVGPSAPLEVYMSKNQYIPLDLTINGKHSDMQVLSNALNTIHESLTMRKSYPSGDKWQIVDITTLTEPQRIGRDEHNDWLFASALLIKLATLTPPPAGA